MEALVKLLLGALQQELEDIDPGLSAIKKFDKQIELVEGAIDEVKKYLDEHPFTDRSSEILYFKSWAPSFFKLHILYTLLYNLERTRITAIDKEELIEYIENERKRLNCFLKEHKNLRIYHQLSQTDMDEILFVSSSPTKKEEFLIASHLYCKNTIYLSKILAYEEYLRILEDELCAGSDNPQAQDLPKSQIVLPIDKYKWKPNKAQTAEVIYSLVKMKCIEVYGNAADIKDVLTFFKEVLGVDIDNIYDVERFNRRRKKDKAPYLRAMMEAYLRPD